MSPRAGRILRRLAVAGAVALVIGAFPAFKTWDYIQNDPSFCTSCHIMDDAYDRWHDSPHAEVNCHTCHPGDIASNLHQLWVQLTDRPTEVVKHAEVPAAICGQCHLADGGRWPVVGETAGHRLHYGQHRIECVECHAPAVHAFIPTDQMCQKCHPAEVVGLSAMQRLHCTSCHDFLAEPARGVLPDDARCGACHAGGGTGPTANEWHPALDCAGCHPVHDAPASVAADPGVEHRGDRALPCEGCHADAAARAMPEGHRCVDCHEPHGGPFEEPICRDCHPAAAEFVPARTHHQCVDCHAPHAPERPAADRCDDCHRAGQALAASTPIEAHRDCQRCHAPHEAGAPDGPRCAQCHSRRAGQAAAAPGPTHRQCAGCHAVHAPESVRPCGGCHPGERKDTAAAPRAHQNCATCHPLHGDPRSSPAPCAVCHADQARFAKDQPVPHRQCPDCHSPHRPQTPGDAACAPCHAAAAASRAAEPPAHQPCGACHAWHSPKLRADDATCRGCHREQGAVRGLPAGFGESHRQCSSCHAGHATRRAKTCADCHQTVTRELAAAPPPHRACASCHGAPHRPEAGSRRACVGCHGEATDGLHRLSAHRACVDCHGGHPPSVPGAAACTGCHPPDRITRHPAAARGAQRCHGCHSFRRDQ